MPFYCIIKEKLIRGTELNILSAEKISKSYSEKILFKDISLGINEGERIGLIGINGTGKSTLLKVIAGVEEPDSGNIIRVNGIQTGYLPQTPVFNEDETVLSHIFTGDSPVMKLISEYEAALNNYSENQTEENQKVLLKYTQSMDSSGAWTIENEAKNILTRLGISDFQAIISKLSGGQKKRVAMAAALINKVDLLILDEPTNHIDNETVEWLEKSLSLHKGALLMVTHDRYFLDRVANRIIELDRGKLFSYQANYTKYLQMKMEREELIQSSEKKRLNLIRNELEWVNRGAKARSTKQKARLDRFEKLNIEKTIDISDKIEITAGSSRLGKKIIELKNVGKDFSGNKFINDLGYIFLRNDRVGIIGPNGFGKSTLLKIIAGIIKPDRGTVETGSTVKIGYFAQENDEMDDNLRVIEYIREQAEYIITPEGTISASQMLERFLFPPETQWTPLSKLSGGEKRRLYLLRVLMGAPNVLLLDEPTNDLDIQTLTILEDYLDSFPGAVISVSHDRYFLDRVADKLFVFKGDGLIKQFEGSYSDYQEYLSEQAAPEMSVKETPKNKENSQGYNKSRPIKFTFNEQNEFSQIDSIIAKLEEELKNIEKGIIDTASDFELLQKLLSEKELVEQKLNSAMDRWIYLNELAEQIERSKKDNS